MTVDSQICGKHFTPDDYLFPTGIHFGVKQNIVVPSVSEQTHER